MPGIYTYLLVDLSCFLVPFLFTFHQLIQFYKEWKYCLLPWAITGLFFLIWDVVFTRMGVWSFNPRFVVGYYLIGLPLEEYLFFFAIPYASLFTYYCVRRYLNFNKLVPVFRAFSFFLVAFLLSIALLNLARWYTSVTFLLLAIFLSAITWSKVSWLPAFFVSFFIILFPFFISNGVLTGSFMPEPVVIYNNHYNLGIRMFTIPVEDAFYGMLFMVMNVAGFEFLKRRKYF